MNYILKSKIEAINKPEKKSKIKQNKKIFFLDFTLKSHLILCYDNKRYKIVVAIVIKVARQLEFVLGLNINKLLVTFMINNVLY